MLNIYKDSAPNGKRENKGHSIICFPDSFCVVDIETTGLSPSCDGIIEIGAIKYFKGIELERFTSLIQPTLRNDGKYIDDFISSLTGITNDDLKDAPKENEVLADFQKFLGEDIIVGYNVGFDINFLYDAFVKTLNIPLTNDYVDLLRVARKLYPELPHHRLEDLLDKYGIENKNAHRALSDVEATKCCFDNMQDEVKKQFGTERSFVDSFKHTNKNIGKSFHAVDIIGDKEKHDPNSPLYNRYCVFTGKLDRYTRQEAMQLVADVGGINEDRVTQKTNYLILGNNDYCTSIVEGKSNKQKQAERYKIKGQDIEIMPENVFYDMIEEYLTYQTVSEENICTCDVSSDWIKNTRKMLSKIVDERNLPKNSLFLEENKSQKDPIRTIGFTIYIWEPSYPPVVNEKPTKNKNVCTINLSTVKARPEELTLYIRSIQASSLETKLPNDATIRPQTKSDIDTGTTRICINSTSENLIHFLEENVNYCIDNYVSKESTFGCCSRYEKCSDLKKCIHENLLYSKACAYRSNLEKGRIFYGKNRNID